MFLWRNKKNINTFGLKKASYQEICIQQRFRSDCTNVQSDLNLCWVHLSENTFSGIFAHVVNVLKF